MKKIDRLFVDFPELKIIEKWIRSEINSKKSKHPIKWVYKRYTLRKPKHFDKAVQFLKTSKNPNELMWADMYLNLYYSGSALLEYLDICFKELRGKEGFGGVLKNLKNSKQFFHTISELEFNSYFANRYQTHIEPKIEINKVFKKLDSEVKLSQRNVLFEIITPELYGLLKNSKVAITIPNRSKPKLLDKLQRQIIPIKDAINSPVVIVLNKSYSDIDEYDIMDSLFGQFMFTMVIDKKTGRMVYDYPDRDQNSLAHTEPLSNYISAVIVYKREARYNGIFFSKEIIENWNPKFPLSTQEYKRLERLDLRKIKSKTRYQFLNASSFHVNSFPSLNPLFNLS